MKLSLKFASLTIATIGLLISLANAMGWIPNPRETLAEQITSLGNDLLPLNTPTLDQFLRHFLAQKYQTYQKQADEMSGIVIEDLSLNASTFGTVYLEHNSGGRYKLCSFQELRDWARDEQFPFWIGWWVAVSGLVFAWVIELLDFRIFRKSNVSVTNNWPSNPQ